MLSFPIGCAAGRIVDGIYRDPQSGFQVRLPPPAWIHTFLDGAALSFRDPALQAGMALAVDCPGQETGELPWMARHVFFGLREMRIEIREPVHLHDAVGVRTRLQARLDDVPVEVEGVTLRRAGCLYDFIYAAPPATFPRGRPDFEAFVESWAPLSAR